MILQRFGNDGDPLVFYIPTDFNFDPNEHADIAREAYNIQAFGQLVLYGFFFFTILHIISIIMGEKSPFLNIQLAFFGFIFYVAVGAKLLSTDWILVGYILPKSYLDKEKAFGSMCILTGLVFLLDTIVSVFKYKKD